MWTGSGAVLVRWERCRQEGRELGGRAWLSYSFKCGFSSLILFECAHTLLGVRTDTHIYAGPEKCSHMHENAHTYTLTAVHFWSSESFIKALKWSQQHSLTALLVTSIQILADQHTENSERRIPLLFPVAQWAGMVWPAGIHCYAADMRAESLVCVPAKIM